MKARMARIADTPFGVFSWLDLWDDRDSHVGRWCTAEDDWLRNAPGVSCIPPGTYRCRRGVFPRTGETFEIQGVQDRSTILFHAGNTEESSSGCVLLGERFGALEVPDEDDPQHPRIQKWAVLDSQRAFHRFLAVLHGTDAFALDVLWAAPGSWRLT